MRDNIERLPANNNKPEHDGDSLLIALQAEVFDRLQKDGVSADILDDKMVRAVYLGMLTDEIRNNPLRKGVNSRLSLIRALLVDRRRSSDEDDRKKKGEEIEALIMETERFVRAAQHKG